MAHLPPHWTLAGESVVMTTTVPVEAAVPPGYRLATEASATVVKVELLAPDGSIAASGRSARHDGVFIYDQIVTSEAHRRRGLGRVVMATLGGHRRAGEREILTATADGEALYTTLGWRVVSPWSTAVIA